ncbi:MAG TPA: IS1595 family transposase [Vicinamibacterales bacterium]|jgi:transposase-like protein
MVASTWPKTLQAAIVYFSDPENAFAEMVKFRWPDGIVKCPTCGSTDVYFTKSRRIWQCKNDHAKRQFSVKIGSIMEDSPLGIDKWLIAVWLITNAKNGISSYELARAIGVTQKSAWFMLHRIRLAMQDETGGTIDGDVEVDETYIGGKARNMHHSKRARVIKARGAMGKAAVMGLLQRNSPEGHSTVRLTRIDSTRRHVLQGHVRAHVEPGTNVYTDALPSYDGLSKDYVHQVIDHAEKYVDGQVHTNGLENFWSLLKRALKGTYVSVEPFHLFRYLDEQAFRFNQRKLSDAGRFALTAASVFGRRLTFKQLTAADATC